MAGETNITPGEIREHLDTMFRLPQCSNLRFWESLGIIDSFLVTKGLAEPKKIPKENTLNNNYYRKEAKVK